ncbi:MAG TPA: hypothetical protein VFC93_17535 [Chloroflexota bacterium]|jgi:hypothetical protein|nr:hypothetical protein [Chloroflexota bacterium]
MGLLRVLCGRGDVKVEWETEKAEAVAEAERIFRENAARGYAAFKVEESVEGAVRIDEFDPTAKEIIQVPRIVGG